MQFRDLIKQYEALKPRIDNAVEQVCKKATFIGGTPVKELEETLANYVGVKHCITCANGTDALQLVEMAYSIGKGDAVFVPDFTFFSTAETVGTLQATPIFVDVDNRTFNMSPKELESAIRRIKGEGKLNPKAIVAVDLFGLPADYEKIESIANKYGLILIEDGAQGFGGAIGKRKVGSFGKAATTSFFPAKPLGCYGDGGAVFTNDDKIASLIRSFCVHGKNASDKYDNIRLGMNSRLDTVQAAVLLVKFEAFVEYELDNVNRVAEWYQEQLNDLNVILPVIPKDYYSSWAQYTIQFASKEIRDKIQIKLKEQGIPSMIYYPKGMHKQGAFSNIEYRGDCKVTERLCETVLSLPMHPYLTKEEIKVIVDEIKKHVIL